LAGGRDLDESREFDGNAVGSDNLMDRPEVGRGPSAPAARRMSEWPSPGHPPDLGTLPSVLWALVPAMTFSLGAPVSFAYAAFRLRSRAVAWSAALYGVLVILSFGLAQAAFLSWQSDLAYAIAVSIVMFGTAHAFAIRKRVFPEPSPGDLDMAAARARIESRYASRRLLDTDPTLAAELGIGRPDLQRSYDDGGLVDVNHVPVEVLARVPGVDEAMAHRIGAVREDVGGFTSVEDLSVTLGIPPHALDEAADRLVFVRGTRSGDV
jgi:hypothetical protein